MLKVQVEHQNYLEKLELPTSEEIVAIAKVQERREEEILKKYNTVGDDDVGAQQPEKQEAAKTIQRTYRGHRDRRQLSGLSLDPSTRWIEAIKEARYRNLTAPRPRVDSGSSPDPPAIGSPRGSSEARRQWKRISQIANRAHGEEDEDENDTSSSSSLTSGHEQAHALAEKARTIKKRHKDAWKGKMMDLGYFLEMVDLKHRYGMNLRAYHQEWKKSDTKENFFYWLDRGEGRDLDLPICSRARLDKEQVRYLSREERLDYLVKIDNEGRLCWAKNGARIDTTDQWKDSIHGVVPIDDKTTPTFGGVIMESKKHTGDVSTTSESSDEAESEESDLKDEGDKRYPSNIKGRKRFVRVSPSAIFDSLLRKSVRKNTWIFVADISMNLYVGIKQSGSFQHSSFLHGSRISAAGLVKIKDGQIWSLSPLSGHYRPPTSAFRNFVEYLKSQEVDLSHASISKAYALLIGLEGYARTKRRLKHAMEKLELGVDKVIWPAAERRKKVSKDAIREALEKGEEALKNIRRTKTGDEAKRRQATREDQGAATGL
ncbi:MAG: hypothetical protein MMC33_002431 [Icmadophila ericetorum]|nr:hypothetical protein [Icmadophila ericetorum]